jgi:hypothetical protein
MQHEEIASIIISHTPCPPLPLSGAYRESRECTDAVVSSHDVLRLVMFDMAFNKPQAMQAEYTRRKAVAERTLVAALDALPGGADAARAYPLFCSYMRDVLAATPLIPGSVSIAPMSYVIAGDSVHRAALDHARAQDVLFGGPATPGGATYSDLVARCAERVISAREPI